MKFSPLNPIDPPVVVAERFYPSLCAFIRVSFRDLGRDQSRMGDAGGRDTVGATQLELEELPICIPC